MSCDEIRRYLSEYIDDHLEPKEKTLVDRHLSACPSCRKAFISMKDLVEELGSMERLEAPKGFLDQLHVRMNEGSRFSRFLRKLFIRHHFFDFSRNHKRECFQICTPDHIHHRISNFYWSPLYFDG